MVHGMITAAECKKKKTKKTGEVWVGSGEHRFYLSRPKPHSFFRSALTIALFAVHFILLTESLE